MKMISIPRQTQVVLLLLFLAVTTTHADPVRSITGLSSITFWERTGGSGPKSYEFGVNSTQLTTILTDPLGTSNYDIQGVIGREFYDVYYSNADGSFNLDGEYLSISGIYDGQSPLGGGLNLAEIGLNFTSTPVEYGNYVASFVALGDNAVPSTVGNAIDGNLLTHTTMGNTVGETQRLRVTLGFNSSSGPVVPVPGAFLIGTLGLSVAGWKLRRRGEL